MIEINKVYQEDCRDTMKKIPDEFIDLCLTDPPYGVGIEYDSYEDNEDNWYDLMMHVIPEMIRISKMVIFPACQINRLKWIYNNFPPNWLICWYKGSVGQIGYLGFNDWEPLLVYGRTKNNLYMHDYLHTPRLNKKGTYNHPCPKPLLWAKLIIGSATENNDLIYDPFAGSGTTLVASKQLGRNFIGSEISKNYCDTIKNRLKSSNKFPKPLFP